MTAENKCVDMDECDQPVTACHSLAECENTIGSFACICPTGYDGGGLDCSDIDECGENPCSSHTTCMNTPGSFECNCVRGYEWDRNRTICVNIVRNDECEKHLHICSVNGHCIDLIGSYDCQWLGQEATQL